MSRLLAGRFWYALVLLPLAAAVGVFLGHVRAGPFELRCQRATNACVLHVQGTARRQFALDEVLRFKVAHTAYDVWELHAELRDGTLRVLAWTDEADPAKAAGALNGFLRDPAVPELRLRWDAGAEWLRDHWFSTALFLVVSHAFLWLARVRARLRVREIVGGKRCPNGHLVGEEALICDECGTRVQVARRSSQAERGRLSL